MPGPSSHVFRYWFSPIVLKLQSPRSEARAWHVVNMTVSTEEVGGTTKQNGIGTLQTLFARCKQTISLQCYTGIRIPHTGSSLLKVRSIKTPTSLHCSFTHPYSIALHDWPSSLNHNAREHCPCPRCLPRRNCRRPSTSRAPNWCGARRELDCKRAHSRYFLLYYLGCAMTDLKTHSLQYLQQ